MNNIIYIVNGTRADLIQSISYWLGIQPKLHTNLEFLINTQSDTYDAAILHVSKESGQRDSFLSINQHEHINPENNLPYYFNGYKNYKILRFAGYNDFRTHLEGLEKQKNREIEIGDVFYSSYLKSHYMLCRDYDGRRFLVDLKHYNTLSKFDTNQEALDNTNGGDLTYVGKMDQFLPKQD